MVKRELTPEEAEAELSRITKMLDDRGVPYESQELVPPAMDYVRTLEIVQLQEECARREARVQRLQELRDEEVQKTAEERARAVRLHEELAAVRTELATVTAERDRWARRMRLLENRIRFACEIFAEDGVDLAANDPVHPGVGRYHGKGTALEFFSDLLREHLLDGLVRRGVAEHRDAQGPDVVGQERPASSQRVSARARSDAGGERRQGAQQLPSGQVHIRPRQSTRACL